MINRTNWLLVKKYLEYRREIDPGLSEKSLIRYKWHLRHLLIWADEDGFAKALRDRRPRFSSYLTKVPGKKTGTTISQETQKKVVQLTRAFFEWLLKYRRQDARGITPALIDTLIPTKTRRIYSEPKALSLEVLLELIAFPYPDTLRNKRDLAAACLLFVSGARADSIASAPIAAIGLESFTFQQRPELGVRTKNAVSQTTFLLQIDTLLEKIRAWDRLVREQLPAHAPWFAVIDGRWGDERLTDRPASPTRAQDLLKAVRRLFKLAGMEHQYKSPHKFRSGHAVYGLSRCKSMEDYHAMSRNLMHSSIAVTDQYYAILEKEKRRNIISGLGSDKRSNFQRNNKDIAQDLKNLLDDYFTGQA